MNLIKEYVLRKKLVMRIRNILSEKIISTLDVNSFSLQRAHSAVTEYLQQ